MEHEFLVSMTLFSRVVFEFFRIFKINTDDWEFTSLLNVDFRSLFNSISFLFKVLENIIDISDKFLVGVFNQKYTQKQLFSYFRKTYLKISEMRLIFRRSVLFPLTDSNFNSNGLLSKSGGSAKEMFLKISQNSQKILVLESLF